jgi:hypothetical protein
MVGGTPVQAMHLAQGAAGTAKCLGNTACTARAIAVNGRIWTTMLTLLRLPLLMMRAVTR